ncbi:endo-1,4-beta-xylanase [Argonema antarcticum]|uniref:endo-1,4-beta-xylanase n=1 Tax=Argonema antarcticum TaxID=2942763 RepID=UPI0020130A6E|nr:endo-1,4-beta-xylanase [Argonema antarcticum]MCL1469345.1 endo-1,4-beta-xylanase [Argonema antarcticum A004/B2]
MNGKLKGRRAFILGLGGLAGVGAFTLESKFRGENNQTQALLALGDAPLRDRATAKGLIYGASTQTNYEKFSQDSQFMSNFVRECALLVGIFTWRAIEPRQGVFDFKNTDKFAKFATDNKMLFKGHPLVWYNSYPKWLIEKFQNANTKAKEIEEILVNHISTSVGRYAGKTYMWDVVNEGIYIPDRHPDGLRDPQITANRRGQKFPDWLHYLGQDYIDIAFRAAAKADPQALLAYNEFGLEYDREEESAKRTAVLKLLERLKSKGTPIHVLGLQGHLLRRGNEMRDFNPAKLKAFLDEVANMGLKIMITEMDVTDQTLPKEIDVRDRIIAKAYQDFLSVVLENPATIGVSTWGLSDRYTWLSERAERNDGAAVRPLPLDAEMKRKLAWNAMALAFDKAPRREVR